MPNNHAARSIADATTESVWHRNLPHNISHPVLNGNEIADLVIVGGGFTGLWTAILAKQAQPDRDVLLIDAQDLGFGGSSRNGGFVSESLTHGISQGLSLWPTELAQLMEMGRDNFREIQEFVAAEAIDAELVACGKTAVATKPHQIAALEEAHQLHLRWGEKSEFLNQEQAQADINSPTYLAATRVRSGGGLMNPAKLVAGLAASAASRGVRIFTNSPVTSLDDLSNGVLLTTPSGTIKANQVVLATNAFTPLKKSIRHRVLPIFDHVLATEKLSAQQLADLRWSESQGVTDSGNQFHYYRKTADGRILWGGYDANYYFGNDTSANRETRPASHELLATHFFQTFPSLGEIKFEYKWAGLIDSTSRFTPFYSVSRTGRVGTVVGFTGLGVGASRFGAKVILDLLAKRDTDLTRLEMVRKKPFPFPPEPLRYATVAFTRKALVKEDLTGRRGLWLRGLDHFGIGFNS